MKSVIKKTENKLQATWYIMLFFSMNFTFGFLWSLKEFQLKESDLFRIENKPATLELYQTEQVRSRRGTIELRLTLENDTNRYFVDFWSMDQKEMFDSLFNHLNNRSSVMILWRRAPVYRWRKGVWKEVCSIVSSETSFLTLCGWQKQFIHVIYITAAGAIGTLIAAITLFFFHKPARKTSS